MKSKLATLVFFAASLLAQDKPSDPQPKQLSRADMLEIQTIVLHEQEEKSILERIRPSLADDLVKTLTQKFSELDLFRRGQFTVRICQEAGIDPSVCQVDGDKGIVSKRVVPPAAQPDPKK